MESPKPGDVVYLVDGDSAIYIAKHPKGGHVVGRMMSSPGDDDEEPHFVDDTPITVKTIFTSPPTPLIVKSLIKKRAELDELSLKIRESMSTLTDIKNQLYNAEVERERLVAKMKQFDALRYLDDWIEGRLGWCVVTRSGPIAMKTEDVVKSDEGWTKPKFRLLSLLGNSSGDLGWSVNAYTDGSGSSHPIHLFKTEEEAKRKAQQLFDEQVDAWRIGGDARNRSTAESWASTPGIIVPPDLAKHLAQRVLTSESNRVQRAEQELAIAKQRLDAAKQKWLDHQDTSEGS